MSRKSTVEKHKAAGLTNELYDAVAGDLRRCVVKAAKVALDQDVEEGRCSREMAEAMIKVMKAAHRVTRNSATADSPHWMDFWHFKWSVRSLIELAMKTATPEPTVRVRLRMPGDQLN